MYLLLNNIKNGSIAEVCHLFLRNNYLSVNMYLLLNNIKNGSIAKILVEMGGVNTPTLYFSIFYVLR